MEHCAIMKKSWGFTDKILSGEKTIESRWYATKRTPWGKVKKGDIVYFKNTGEPVSIKADVKDVLSFSDLTPAKEKYLLLKYGKAIGIESKDMKQFLASFKDKRYCILIVLKNPEKIRPFDISKKGFGAMAAWITIPDIRSIRCKT
jgi:ASC-1-like (ASCH) protein